MTISVDATYEDGVLKPAHPLPLCEHEKVHVTVQPQRAAEKHSTMADDPAGPSGKGGTLAEQILALARDLPAGALDNLPDDLAAEHDHYLYGTPKRSK